ncbi:sugar kinase [Psychromonas ossibalaenae]|uniref:sugar kinase n=1 Tax=Psychromonas ossibalaenae TaxID=444922 RepID=UPI000381892F|nr:sugar kinase [Psychromonas ossibalaenae]
MKIAFFGECVIELSGQPIQRTFSGDTLNTALYLSRLVKDQAHLEPVEVFYATAMGSDAVSNELIESWQDEGINTLLVSQFDDKHPGLSLIESDLFGELSFSYWRNDSAAKYYFRRGLTKLEQQLDQFDYFYLSGNSLAFLPQSCREYLLTLLMNFKVFGGKIIFDNNYQQHLWSSVEAKKSYKDILTLTDIALISEENDFTVFEDQSTAEIIDRCKEYNVSEVVIKRGRGASLVINYDSVSMVTPKRVDKVIDRNGAGDSFAAAYLAVRLNTGTAKQAAEFGHELAGKVIQYPGAIIPSSAMPEMVEISKRYNRYISE